MELQEQIKNALCYKGDSAWACLPNGIPIEAIALLLEEPDSWVFNELQPCDGNGDMPSTHRHVIFSRKKV